MPAYSGSSLYMQWASSAGTVTPNTDYRTLTYTPSIEFYDETAGADPSIQRIAGMKDGQIKLNFLMQAGGTAMTNALIEGASGTLIVAPEGTATGKQKITLPAISMGAAYAWAYNALTEVNCDLQQNGARVDGIY